MKYFDIRTKVKLIKRKKKGDPEKLADIKQWVCACVDCHDAIEHDAKLTEEVFMRLRGEETI